MVITLYLLFVMFAVFWFDSTRYVIPNWLTGSLLALYPIAAWLSPEVVDWQKDLLGMLGVFVVGYIMFARKMMGGGDIKLIIVCSLWVGVGHLMDFVFMFAIIGGVLSIALYLGRKMVPFMKLKKQPPRLFREGEPVPYGIAISASFLILMSKGHIPVIVGAGLGI